MRVAALLAIYMAFGATGADANCPTCGYPVPGDPSSGAPVAAGGGTCNGMFLRAQCPSSICNCGSTEFTHAGDYTSRYFCNACCEEPEQAQIDSGDCPSSGGAIVIIILCCVVGLACVVFGVIHGLKIANQGNADGAANGTAVAQQQPTAGAPPVIMAAVAPSQQPTPGAPPKQPTGKTTVRQLRDQAEAAGVSGNTIDEARDADDPQAALRALIEAAAPKAPSSAELQQLSVKILRERAATAGVSNDAVDIARDGDDPKGDIIQLILAATSGPPPVDLVALRAELSLLNLKDLRARAASAGVDPARVEEARDGEDPKSEMIQLILAQAGGSVGP